MKKLLVVLIAVLALVTLTACNGSGNTQDTSGAQNDTSPTENVPVESNQTPEPPTTPSVEEQSPPEEPTEYDYGDIEPGQTGGVPLGITIVRLDPDDNPGPLADVSFMHIFNHNEIAAAADWFGDLDENLGDTLMIQTFTPLYDFSVISVRDDMLGDDLIWIPIEFYGTVENFLPGEAFIIQSYLGLGTLPWSGISFLDENGQRWYFLIVQNQMDDGDPYLLVEFQNRTDELPAN